MAVAREPRLVAERLLDRLAERDADVLDRVVRIDVQIALGVDRRGRSCRGARPGRACGRGTARRSRARRGRCRRDRRSTRDLRFARVALDARLARRVAGVGRTVRQWALIEPGSSPLQRGEQRVVFRRRADGDTQAVRQQRMPAVQILDQDAAFACSPSNQRGRPRERAPARNWSAFGNTVTPGNRASAAASRARSARIVAACSAEPAGVRRAARGAAACVNALTLYGGRILSSSRDPLGRGDRIAQTHAGHADLGHRAQHQQIREFGDARQEARSANA